MIKFGYSVPVPKKKKRATKYDFTGMRKGAHAWFPGTTQTVLTSFKNWCRRNNKNWLGQTERYYNEAEKAWGTMIWRIK